MPFFWKMNGYCRSAIEQELNLLQKKACFRRIRGTTVNGVRLIYANIYFTADGSRIYGEEEKTIK